MTTTVEYSVEVDAPPEKVWAVTSDPRDLPAWERLIESVRTPPGGLAQGVEFEVLMAFIGVRATIKCTVVEWEPPWRSAVRLRGLLDATVMTSVASLPFDRSVLRHEVRYVFNRAARLVRRGERGRARRRRVRASPRHRCAAARDRSHSERLSGGGHRPT